MLMRLLCPVSLETLHRFQDTWDGTRPFDEFVVAQNKEIRKCVELEMSELGREIRAKLHMDPLTPETEVQ
jgi:hypothetical protein